MHVSRVVASLRFHAIARVIDRKRYRGESRHAESPYTVVGFDAAAAVMGGGGGGGGTAAALALVLATAIVVAVSRAEVLGYTETVWLDRQGPLKGLVTTVGGDRGPDQADVYLGVPYAASQERFMPPGESPTWCPKADDGSFDRSHCRPLRAEYMRPVCPQRPPDLHVANRRLSAARQNYLRRLTPYMGNQSEDCLFLNIYAPHGEHHVSARAIRLCFRLLTLRGRVFSRTKHVKNTS